MKAADKKKLKALAHTLNPIVMIGQSGYTAAVLSEIELALDNHELIKLRIRAERDGRKQIAEKICSDTNAELIQTIGQILVIFRKNLKK